MNRWMNGTSHRALMAAETGTGSGTPDAAAAAASASSPSAGPASPGTEATASTVTSPDASATATVPQPAADAAARSLLEGAPAKPTPEPKADAAAAAKPPETPAKPGETPAPADAAKSEPTEAKPADSKADAKEPVKADDPAKAADGKDPAAKPDPAKEATARQPPAALVIEDLKLPDGVKLADEPAKAFLETLNKADTAPKDRAQGLLDLHMKEMQRITTEVAKQRDDHQRKVWGELNIERKNELKREFGNTWETRLSYAKAVIEEYGGTPEQKAILFDRLSEDKGTGMGNDVHLNRLLANIGKALNVFEDGIVAANPKAPSMPKGSPGSGKTGWYADNGKAAG